MSRPSKLTHEIQEAILRALRAGNYFSVACELAGIPEQTGREWLARGRGRHSTRRSNKQYAAFAEAVKKAEIEGEVASLLVIRRAAKGGERTVVKVKTTNRPDGTVIEERIEGVTPPDWHAAAWYLERKHPDRWARTARANGGEGEGGDADFDGSLWDGMEFDGGTAGQ